MKIAKLFSLMAIAASLAMVSCAELPETEDEGNEEVETPVEPGGTRKNRKSLQSLNLQKSLRQRLKTLKSMQPISIWR